MSLNDMLMSPSAAAGCFHVCHMAYSWAHTHTYDTRVQNWIKVKVVSQTPKIFAIGQQL